MKKDKYRVTVSGWVKLLVLIALIGATAYLQSWSTEASVSMLVYTLLFVYLSVIGSDNSVAEWISDKNLFHTIFLVPSFISALYSGIFYLTQVDNSSDEMEIGFMAFAALLSILSIPLGLILLNMQNGIRRWNALIMFVALPITIFILCSRNPEKMLKAGGCACLVMFIIFLLVSAFEHKADISASSDTAYSGGRDYVAKWAQTPDSKIDGTVIFLRGTIIVEYRGTFDKWKASNAVNNLLNSYANHVARENPGYSVVTNDIKVQYSKNGG